MQIITWLATGCAVFFVIYIILKGYQYKHKNKPQQPAKRKKINVEIRSDDLYMMAENLIALHEVYALQVEQLSKDIEAIEDEILIEKQSYVGSDTTIKRLVSRSLKLQENKCKIESKMIKLMNELDKLAKEEYRRQTTEG